MRILQKKDTQVSELNRRIGRKQVLNARERMVGDKREASVIEELPAREQAQWKKLPEWKKQKILEKVRTAAEPDGRKSQNGYPENENRLQSFHKGQGSNQRRAGNRVQGSGQGINRARRGYIDHTLHGGAHLKEGNLSAKEDTLFFHGRKEARWQRKREMVGKNVLPEGLADVDERTQRDFRQIDASFSAGRPSLLQNEKKHSKMANEKEEDEKQEKVVTGYRNQEHSSLFYKPKNARLLRTKKKQKLMRLIEKNSSWVKRMESNVTNDQALSQRTDQVLKTMGGGLGRSLTRSMAKGIAHLIRAAVASIAAALGSTVGVILIPILLIVLLIFGIALSGSGGVGRANVSPECERYRPLVVEYAKKHEVEDFVEIILCIMMQESGGRVPDVMQCSECPFNTKYPHSPNSIPDPEYSIDVGIQNFKACLEEAGCTKATDLEGVKLALQTYNYGNGYAAWAKTSYGGYSPENAKLFSTIWASKYGWSQYGDPEYVPHVLRYYVMSGGFVSDEITNPEAAGQLEMLMTSWPAEMDERRGAVIAKGASRIGLTTYDMFGEDTRSGVDNPRTLDCSSFTAWAYQKAGFTDVPYGSTTGTFVGSANFRQISASELVPGDVGLINTIPEGGNNHVGIYVGQDANGSGMWMHCTDYATPGCSTVISGPRISYYPAFTIFYRYTGFQ